MTCVGLVCCFVADYSDLPGLEHLYLEDSYVLGIREQHDELRFELEAVLTEDHPRWAPPKPGEAYAYRRVDLVFVRPSRVWWIEQTMQPVVGPGGDVDFGNIDSFTWRAVVSSCRANGGASESRRTPRVAVDRGGD